MKIKNMKGLSAIFVIALLFMIAFVGMAMNTNIVTDNAEAENPTVGGGSGSWGTWYYEFYPESFGPCIWYLAWNNSQIGYQQHVPYIFIDGEQYNIPADFTLISWGEQEFSQAYEVFFEYYMDMDGIDVTVEVLWHFYKENANVIIENYRTKPHTVDPVHLILDGKFGHALSITFSEDDNGHTIITRTRNDFDTWCQDHNTQMVRAYSWQLNRWTFNYILEEWKKANSFHGGEPSEGYPAGIKFGQDNRVCPDAQRDEDGGGDFNAVFVSPHVPADLPPNQPHGYSYGLVFYTMEKQGNPNDYIDSESIINEDLVMWNEMRELTYVPTYSYWFESMYYVAEGNWIYT